MLTGSANQIGVRGEKRTGKRKRIEKKGGTEVRVRECKRQESMHERRRDKKPADVCMHAVTNTYPNTIHAGAHAPEFAVLFQVPTALLPAR